MIIRTTEDVQKASALLDTQLEVAFDTETTGLSVRHDKVIGFSCAAEGFSFYVVLLEWNGAELVEVIPKAAAVPLLEKLKSKRLIGHNSSFDTRITWHYFGVKLWPHLFADTMLMAHLADENRFSYGLKDLGAELFGSDSVSERDAMKESISANGGAKKEFYKADSQLLAEYGRKDAELTFNLFKHFKKQLHYNGLSNFFLNKETMPMYREVVIEMEVRGLCVDVPLLQKSLSEITIDMDRIEAEIQEAIAPNLDLFNDWYLNKQFPVKLTGPFINKLAELMNVNLPRTKTGAYSFTAKNIEALPDCRFKQIFLKQARMTNAEILDVQLALQADSGERYMFNIQSKDHWKRMFFTKLGETPLSKTDLGSPQVTDEFLDLMAQKYEWAEKLRTYNKLLKIRSTYIERILEEQENGIFYPSFFMHRTTSGRLGGDIQQLPRIKNAKEIPNDLVREYNNRIRNFFISAPDWKLVDADYSSLEVVVFADDAQDEALLDIIRNDFDFYSQVAIQVNGLTEYSADKKAPNFLKDHRPELRQAAKAYSLGIRYGLRAYKLSKDLGISEQEAKQIVNNYFKSFPKLKTRMDELIASAKSNGWVRSKSGRIRHLPDLKKLNDQYGDVLYDGLELWKKYNEMPGTYESMKKKARVASNLVNNSLNYPIQSLAGSIVSQASIAIAREYKERGLQAYLCLNVHDELCTHCPDSEVEAVCEIMQRRMENTITLSVPLQAEPIVGTRYGDVK